MVDVVAAMAVAATRTTPVVAVVELVEEETCTIPIPIPTNMHHPNHNNHSSSNNNNNSHNNKLEGTTIPITMSECGNRQQQAGCHPKSTRTKSTATMDKSIIPACHPTCQSKSPFKGDT